MRRATALLVAALFVALAACSGESNDPSASRSGKRKPDTTTTSDPGCRYIVAADGTRHIEPPTKTLDYLSEATVEPTTCYDKVTFTFEAGDNVDLPPGYTVEYREPPLVEVDGKRVPNSTEGFKDARAVLYVEFTPTATFDGRNPGAGRDTYKGNLRLIFDSEAVRHTVIVEWVDQLPDTTPEDVTDNKVVWLIGLDEKRPFTVDAVNQPPRVSVLILR